MPAIWGKAKRLDFRQVLLQSLPDAMESLRAISGKTNPRGKHQQLLFSHVIPYCMIWAAKKCLLVVQEEEEEADKISLIGLSAYRWKRGA